MSDDSSAHILPSELRARPRSVIARSNEGHVFALSIVRDPTYRKNLFTAMQQRRVAPAVELAVLAYAYGKPPIRVEVGSPGAFSELNELSTAELASRARALAEELEQAAEGESLPDELELQRRTDEALAAAARSTEEHV